MIHIVSFFCLCLLATNAVFSNDTNYVKSVSVTEGDLVTLNTGVTEIQGDDQILWMFGPQGTRIAQIYEQKIKTFNHIVLFGDRLKMDSQTGSLTIRNIRPEHTGLYKLQVMQGNTSYKNFNVAVSPLPFPIITRNSSNFSSSDSSCSVVCSVASVHRVTLSWLKGNRVLSSISVSDLSISLPLKIQCLDDSYRCAVTYSHINQTKNSNITDQCQPCSEQGERSRLIMAVVVPIAMLVFTAGTACLIYRRRKKQPRKEVKTLEVLYTEVFRPQGIRKSERKDDVDETQTVYSSIKT